MCASIAPSPTLAIDAKAKEMRRSGRDVVSFSVGEPDFVTPQYIRTAAHEALDMGLTKYTPAAGTLGLRRAICEKLRWDNGLEYSPSEVIVSNGAKFSIYAALAAIVNPGDESSSRRRAGFPIRKSCASSAACRCWCRAT